MYYSFIRCSWEVQEWKMSERFVLEEPMILELVPDHYKTEEIFKQTVEENSLSLKFVFDQYNNKEMSKGSVKKWSSGLEFVLDEYKI